MANLIELLIFMNVPSSTNTREEAIIDKEICMDWREAWGTIMQKCKWWWHFCVQWVSEKDCMSIGGNASGGTPAKLCQTSKFTRTELKFSVCGHCTNFMQWWTMHSHFTWSFERVQKKRFEFNPHDSCVCNGKTKGETKSSIFKWTFWQEITSMKSEQQFQNS